MSIRNSIAVLTAGIYLAFCAVNTPVADGILNAGNVNLSTPQTFTAVNSWTSTDPIAPAAGALSIGGNSSSVTMQAGGNGAVSTSVASGLQLQGQGSSNDVVIRNKSGTAVLSIGTGTTTSTFSGSIVSGSSVSAAVNSQINFTGARGIFTSTGAGQVQMGAAQAAAPVNQTITTQGSRGGTDTNVGGGTLTIQSGLGTGTGALSNIALQSPGALQGSGSTQQVAATGLLIQQGVAIFTNYTVANLPAASAALTGAHAFVTDATATAITGLGLAVTGGGANKVVVYCDGTNWLIL